MPKFELTSTPSTEDKLDASRARDDLFTVDGVAFGMLKEYSARESLYYASLVRQQGYDIAAAWAVEVGLGYVGYMALVGNPNTTDEQVEYVIKLATSRVLGRPDPKSPAFSPAVSESSEEGSTTGSADENPKTTDE
jgi:hypothetical protein